MWLGSEIYRSSDADNVYTLIARTHWRSGLLDGRRADQSLDCIFQPALDWPHVPQMDDSALYIPGSRHRIHDHGTVHGTLPVYRTRQSQVQRSCSGPQSHQQQVSQREQIRIWPSNHPQHLRLRPLDGAADHSVSNAHVHGEEDATGLLVLHRLAFLHWLRDAADRAGSHLQ